MNIFVGCSSRDTKNVAYIEAAKSLGDYIVEHRLNFVFGGCEMGLMGQVYQIVKESKHSKIVAIQAKAYEEELNNLEFDDAYVLDTVNDRKNAYQAQADVLVFLPGGIGTIDEIMSAIETKRSREHNHPIIIVNVENYFNPLLKMFEAIYSEGFADIKNKECYQVVGSLEELRDILTHIANKKYE